MHRWHVNPWLVAVIVLGVAVVALGTWVIVDRYTGGDTATQDATTLIDNVSAAYTTNDAAALASYYAPDAVIRSLGDEYTGIATIQSLASGTWQVERIAPVTVDGEFATTFVTLHAGDQARTAVATFQIEDGKIVRQWGFALGETSPFDNAVMP
jgi:ketosteroid isomerase-like protein